MLTDFGSRFRRSARSRPVLIGASALTANTMYSLNNDTIVTVIAADPVVATDSVAASGFVVNKTNGKVWATNQTDTFYYDESTGTLR